MTPLITQLPLGGAPTAFTPSTSSVADSVILTALVGVAPLILFFVLMGAFKVKTHWCALISLAVSAVLSVVAFHMPAGMVGLSASQGLAMGFMPIIYIIIAAVWLYNLTEVSGRSADLKAVFNVVGKGDVRVQALIVGFSFCGLLEGLAGFGAPVAITGALLVTLGVEPIRAALVTIVGNAIYVGFGAMAIPVTTAAKLGGDHDPAVIAQTMSHITWLFCLLIPFLLLGILDGGRAIKQLWPLALIQGLATGAGQFIAPYISYELTSVLAALLGLAASYIFLRFWTPTTPEEHRSAVASTEKTSAERIGLALMPYVLVVVIIALTKLIAPLKAALAATDLKIAWPGLDGQLLTESGEPSTSTIYTLSTLSNPGTWIFVTALIVAVVYGLNSSGGRYPTTIKRMLAVLPETIWSLRIAIVTIAAVMALAYVMNFSGQTASIGAALAATGTAFAFLSPMLGWVGTAVAGSATSAGALFANLQSSAAAGVGLDPRVLLAANTIGGGLGKIVSPQNLAVVAGAVQAEGSDPEILKKAIPFSLGLLVLLGAVTFVAAQGWLGAYMPA